MKLNEIINKIQGVNRDIEAEARKKMDSKTKPQGSLGRLEEIAIRMSMIQNNLNPEIKHKSIFVFAGDHGIAMEGVSAYPSEVTPQMVMNFINGGAAINVLCRLNNINMRVVDIGVNFDFDKEQPIIHRKIQKGTRNFVKEPAMTREDAIKAFETGIEVFNSNLKDGIDIVGLGDMGIGNTTSSSAIISAITGKSPEATAGRGTGLDDRGLNHKVRIIEKSLAYHKPDKGDAIDILHKIGGFEIGGIAGMIMAAACNKKAAVLDGIISTAGGLLAYLLCPAVKDYIFAAHKSTEMGQTIALEHIGLSPILDLNMRLGEGTGSALAMNIIDASCRIMRGMASFEDAGVSNRS